MHRKRASATHPAGSRTAVIGSISGTDGFSLVEVVVAMVIVAVGLLALQGLGIAAARAVSIADRQTEYARVMTDSLDSAIRQLRQGMVPGEFCLETPHGARISRAIDLGSARLATVSIAVIPPSDDSAAILTMESAVFLPATLVGPDSGGACA